MSNVGPSQNRTDMRSAIQKTREKKRNSSPLFYYFGVTEVMNTVMNKCLNCSKLYCVNDSNGTLVSHLMQHGYLLSTSRVLNNQAVITRSGSSFQKNVQSPRESQNEKTAGALIKRVASSSITFSVVESTSFLKIINFLDGKYSLPSLRPLHRKTIADCKSTKAKMKSIIHSEEKAFCLTTDACWSRTFKGFIAVTLHYITSDGKLRNMLLEFKHFVTSQYRGLAFNVIIEFHSRERYR